MFIEHVRLKRSKTLEWETALYVGKYENSEESVLLDKDYKIIDEVYDMRSIVGKVRLSLPEVD